MSLLNFLNLFIDIGCAKMGETMWTTCPIREVEVPKDFANFQSDAFVETCRDQAQRLIRE
jgi:hypothetical protein